MHKISYAILLISVLSITSCKAKVEGYEVEKPNIKTVVKDQQTILVDVRTIKEYQTATASNATNIPLADLEQHLDQLKGKNVVVFCNKGKQADQAVKILQNSKINVYDGTSWRNVKAIQDEK